MEGSHGCTSKMKIMKARAIEMGICRKHAAVEELLSVLLFNRRKRRIELLGKVERLADTFDLSGQELFDSLMIFSFCGA